MGNGHLSFQHKPFFIKAETDRKYEETYQKFEETDQKYEETYQKYWEIPPQKYLNKIKWKRIYNSGKSIKKRGNS